MCLVHLTPGTAADKIGACFAGFLAKQVTLLAVSCCHLLTLLPDLVTIIYVRHEVLAKNWPKTTGDFWKIDITFWLNVDC